MQKNGVEAERICQYAAAYGYDDPLCGIFSSTGAVPDDKLSGGSSEGTGGGSRDGWLWYLPDHLPDHHADAQGIYCDSCNHDIPEQLG